MGKNTKANEQPEISKEQLVEENKALQIQLHQHKLVKSKLENKLGEVIGNFTALQLSFEQMQEYAASLEKQIAAE